MSEQKQINPIEVLLVEDDPGDVELTREVLAMTKVRLNLSVVDDGVETLRFLRNEGEYQNAPRPDLILLDLNMPKKDGRETLEEIKATPSLKHIPVVILTTSNADEDIVKSYASGASCYITKPVGLDQFTKVVKAVEGFWLSVVKYPPRE